MTECHVSCYECGENRTPKIWRWLCEECAEEQRDRHRHETGHNPELHIALETTVADILRDIGRVHRITGGRKW